MKKLAIVVMLVAMVSSFAFANGSKEAAPAEKFHIDLATNSAIGSLGDTYGQAFTKVLNDSGLFEATWYPNSQLGAPKDCFEMIQQDQPVIFLGGGGSDWGDAFNVPNLGCSMTPFLVNSMEEIYGLLESDLWKGMIKDAEKDGAHIINVPLMAGTRYFVTNKMVRNPEELKGQKLRTPTSSFYLNAMTAFGAVPVPIAVGEAYTALSQKMADGLEFTYADTILRQFYEVVHYMANQPYVFTFNFPGMSVAVWDSLTAEQQKVINEAAKKASEVSFSEFTRLEDEARVKLKELGMTFYDIDVDSYKACMPKFYELSGWTQDFINQLDKVMTDYRASKK